MNEVTTNRPMIACGRSRCPENAIFAVVHRFNPGYRDSVCAAHKEMIQELINDGVDWWRIEPLVLFEANSEGAIALEVALRTLAGEHLKGTWP